MDVHPIRLLLLGATLIGLLSCASSQAESTSATLLEGIRLYKAGQFTEAIPYFDQVLAKHPRDISTRNKRGICYLRTNQPVLALADFDRIKDAGGRLPIGFGERFGSFFGDEVATIPEGYGNRGLALLMLGRNDEALESFHTAIQQWKLPLNQPGSFSFNKSDKVQIIRSKAAAYQGAARAYHLLGQDDSALEFANQGIEIDSTDPNGYCGRGDIFASRRAFDRAIADYQRAIQLDPAHSRAIAGLGIVDYEQGHDEAAIAHLDRAIELDPQVASAYSYRGALFARRGQNDRALAEYDKLLALYPNDPGALKDRGGVLVRVGQFDRAVKDLNQSIRIDPKRAAAYQNRGAAFNGLGQFERAIEDLSEAIRLTPTSCGAYGNRGLAHYAIGQYDQAVADLSEAIKCDPRSAVARLNRADVFARLGLRDRAAMDLDQATQLDPGLVASYTKTHGLDGRLASAPPEQDMALLLDPNEVSSHYEVGNAHRDRGDWAAALKEYDRVIATRPDLADAYVARGWTRLIVGVKGAAADAHAYRTRKGWNDPFTPYMAVLEALAEGSAGAETAKRRALDDSIGHLAPRSWPTPVLRYLRGDTNETTLLKEAVGPRQQSEAHAFLGIDRLQHGDAASGTYHLRMAIELGSAGSIATDVSRAMLARESEQSR